MTDEFFIVVDVGLRRLTVLHVFGQFSEDEVEDVKEDITQYYVSWWRWLGILDNDNRDTRISVVKSSDLEEIISKAGAVEYRDVKSIK